MSGVKRVLITGASGLLGRAVIKKFQSLPQQWKVLGLAFSRATGDLLKVDLTDTEAVFKTVEDFKPDVIIHCAAERRPDVVEKEPEATQKLNIEATSTLCKVAVQCGSWLLYISTDYVFDGKKPPYQVTDKPNPLNKYGASKLEGEKIVENTSSEFSILRVPLLYGQVQFVEESAATILLKNIQKTGASCPVSDYERRYPTHCDNVASVIEAMSQKRCQQQQGMSGVFHWSNEENMTKYDMTTVIAEVFCLESQHIVADKMASSGATRSYNSELCLERLDSFNIRPDRIPFREGIKNALQPFVSS